MGRRSQGNFLQSTFSILTLFCKDNPTLHRLVRCFPHDLIFSELKRYSPLSGPDCPLSGTSRPNVSGLTYVAHDVSTPTRNLIGGLKYSFTEQYGTPHVLPGAHSNQLTKNEINI